ncbi:copper resistance protein CopC [Solirubrobacter ginsenosidimutans]|uniref:Copper resistance protein CopC n=1 Tax=Solirubrobacter ginsenosidimutans TaxID=490573 RepID=A0A9X3MTX1_9ACTN|nr:copper resistance protein CopC [Solirubrobacter ginsenosidimutans]MDA0162372.1 copper resistance protein CopC [Solirubrobacter ginsenosidimutans]
MKTLARGLIAALLCSLVWAPIAWGHATIVRTSPADGAVVKTQPASVKLRWSEAVDLGPGSVRLLDASGKLLKTEKARHDGGDQTTAVMALPSGLANGTYVVAWRVTSADSHPVSGAFSFSVGAPSALVTAGESGSSGTAVKLADGIFRAVAFIGFALAVGGAFVLLFLWPQGRSSARGRTFLGAGLGALLLGTVAVLLLQGPYATGGSLVDTFKPSLLSFSVSTHFGQALIARILLALAFTWLIERALRPGGAVNRLGLAACVVGLVLTWTLTDHSRTGVQVWLGIPAASAHLLAMSLWLGGLALLLFCVLVREVSLLPVVPRFSRMALLCFGVLGVTGVYLSWRQSGELAALPATEFGRLLLIKSGIVLVIIGLAALSRRAVQRGGEDLGRRLRRTVAVEAVLGVVVLGVTATLVNAAPARVKYAPPYDITVRGPEGGKVQVHVVPAKQGQNVTDVYLVQRDGRLLVPPEITGRLKPPSGTKDLGPLPVDLTAAEPGHYVATAMSVPNPGHWTLELSVRTSDIDESVIDVPVRIR